MIEEIHPVFFSQQYEDYGLPTRLPRKPPKLRYWLKGHVKVKYPSKGFGSLDNMIAYMHLLTKGVHAP